MTSLSHARRHYRQLRRISEVEIHLGQNTREGKEILVVIQVLFATNCATEMRGRKSRAPGQVIREIEEWEQDGASAIRAMNSPAAVHRLTSLDRTTPSPLH